MKKRSLVIAGALVASLAVAAVAGAAGAHGPGGFGAGFDGPPGMTFGGLDHHGPRHFHGLIRALDLSEDQRDKIFDIVHGQVRAARDKMKELRKGHDALHEVAAADSFDARKVRELADAQASTIADLIVMRTETFNKIHGLLTPEQQKKLAELKDSGWHGPRRR